MKRGGNHLADNRKRGTRSNWPPRPGNAPLFYTASTLTGPNLNSSSLEEAHGPSVGLMESQPSNPVLGENRNRPDSQRRNICQRNPARLSVTAILSSGWVPLDGIAGKLGAARLNSSDRRYPVGLDSTGQPATPARDDLGLEWIHLI